MLWCTETTPAKWNDRDWLKAQIKEDQQLVLAKTTYFVHTVDDEVFC